MRLPKIAAVTALAVAAVLAVAAAERPVLDRGQAAVSTGKAPQSGTARGTTFRRLSRPTSSYAPGKVIVKFKPSLFAQSADLHLQAYGSSILRRVPEIGVTVARVPEGSTVPEMLAALRRNPDVEYAEPDYRVRISATPNDPYFGSQWALSNPGGTLDIPGAPTSKKNADVGAPTAWDITEGDPAVVIAIVDTGVDLEHPDLKAKLVSGGRDFIDDDYTAQDEVWHGTHVAGIAAADTNNGVGVAGVAWKCKIVPVRVIGASGEGDYDQLIQGIIWAANNGAKVINMSVGGDQPADSLKEALRFAYDKGVVLVAAAGNHEAEAGEPTGVSYPGAYDEYVLAVAATDFNDARPDWSNTGSQVDVAAPGVDVLGPVPTWYFGSGALPYAYASGTSMACPHASGMAALILSAKPWLKPADVMNVIRYTAADVNAADHKGKDDLIGYGRIDMGKALSPYLLK